MFCFLAPEKGPTIKSITPLNSTALKVTWEKLSLNDSNGIVTNYTVCYQLASSEKVSCANNIIVTGEDATTANLIELNEATVYDVAVKAATVEGLGPLGPKMNGETLEAGKRPNYIMLVCTFSTIYNSGIFILIFLFKC